MHICMASKSSGLPKEIQNGNVYKQIYKQAKALSVKRTTSKQLSISIENLIRKRNTESLPKNWGTLCTLLLPYIFYYRK